MNPLLATVLLLPSCVRTQDASINFPCPEFDPLESRLKVSSGSKVDKVWKRGIFPTRIKYPDVVKNVGEDDPKLDLFPALAVTPFVESIDYDDENCIIPVRSPGVFNIFGYSLFVDSGEEESEALKHYDDYGRIFSSAYIRSPPTNTESKGSLADILALTQSNWNNSYYNNVRDLILEDHAGCNSAQLVVSTNFLGGVKLDGSRRGCRTLTEEFLNDMNNLIDEVSKFQRDDTQDVDAYLTFCTKYGWYYQEQVQMGANTFRVKVDSTKYHLGRVGEANFTAESCKDPDIGVISLIGWNTLFDALGLVNHTFDEFYAMYPLDDTEVKTPDVEALKKEQLFTYEGVYDSCYSTLPPSTEPATTPTSSAAAFRLLSLVIDGLLAIIFLQ